MTLLSQITTSNARRRECLCLMLGLQDMKQKMPSSPPGIWSNRRRRGGPRVRTLIVWGAGQPRAPELPGSPCGGYLQCPQVSWPLPSGPMGSEGKLGRGRCLPTKYASRMTSAAEMMMALRAAHFQLQYLEGFLRLKAGRAKVLRGSGRGGGEYTVLEVRGYPGDVVQKSGEVPPGLKRKCLWMKRSQRASGLAGSPGTQVNLEDRGRSRRSMHRSLERDSCHREDGGGGAGKRRITYQTTKQGSRGHVSTEHGWDSPAQRESHPRQGRRCYLLDRRLGAEILFLGRDGAGGAVSWGIN